MKRLHFAKPNDLSKLHDELLAALPTLRKVRVGADGLNQALPENMGVEGLGNDIWLTVPDAADEAAIAAVVAAHNALTPRPPTAQEVARVKAVSDAAAEVTAEIDKAFAARGLPLTEPEKTRITGRQLNLVAKVQGR